MIERKIKGKKWQTGSSVSFELKETEGEFGKKRFLFRQKEKMKEKENKESEA